MLQYAAGRKPSDGSKGRKPLKQTGLGIVMSVARYTLVRACSPKAERLLLLAPMGLQKFGTRNHADKTTYRAGLLEEGRPRSP